MLCCHGFFSGRNGLMGRVVYVVSGMGFWKVFFVQYYWFTIGNYLGCLMPAIANKGEFLASCKPARLRRQVCLRS
jgi:hypothetical protein